MDLTAEEVDTVEETRQLVADLRDVAEESDTDMLDEANLRLLEAQLDALHQALSLAVSQKEGMQE